MTALERVPLTRTGRTPGPKHRKITDNPELQRRELTTMWSSMQIKGMHRLLLAILIAVAVALAPVASALAASDAMAKSAMHDCHGKKPVEDHSCCDKMAKCPDQCGVKCCKLVGVIAALPGIDPPVFVAPEVAHPQKPPDWRLRPRPPPPRV